MTIGYRIKQKRIEEGITVEDLAKKLGKNRATIYRYENNDIENLPITIIEPIAAALNTTPAYLMGWIDDPNEWERIENDEENLLSYYHNLNNFGKLEAKKRIKELTMISLYTDTIPVLNAAHERTDIEVTDKMRKEDDEIMNDDDF